MDSLPLLPLLPLPFSAQHHPAFTSTLRNVPCGKLVCLLTEEFGGYERQTLLSLSLSLPSSPSLLLCTHPESPQRRLNSLCWESVSFFFFSRGRNPSNALSLSSFLHHRYGAVIKCSSPPHPPHPRSVPCPRYLQHNKATSTSINKDPCLYAGKRDKFTGIPNMAGGFGVVHTVAN